jgi:hypothetical protein
MQNAAGWAKMQKISTKMQNLLDLSDRRVAYRRKPSIDEAFSSFTRHFLARLVGCQGEAWVAVKSRMQLKIGHSAF